MIAHVAQAGEGRGRVVLHLTASATSPIAIEAAIRVARAFQSEIEGLFVEDTQLLDIASLPFTCEISLSGRERRELTLETVSRQMRASAAAIARRVADLARSAEVPVHMTVVRSDPIDALARACADCGPWNVVALGEPVSAPDATSLAKLFSAVPGTTGLVVVGPRAKRVQGRIVGIVEDIADFDHVLRTARRLQEASGETELALLLVSDSADEAERMDEHARLAIGGDDTIALVRARVEPNAPGVAAELIRRLAPGFIVGRFGGLIVPPEGDLRQLSAVLECPLFLMR